MVINLSEYRKAKRVRLEQQQQQYCAELDERLCVNWNPAFGVIALTCYQSPQELSPELPEDNEAIAPGFCERVGALATQI